MLIVNPPFAKFASSFQLVRLVYFTALAWFYLAVNSCKNGTQTPSDTPVQISDTLQAKFGQAAELIYGEDTLLASKEVLNYYRKNNFRSVWITHGGLTPAAIDFCHLIRDAKDYGLLPEMFHYAHIMRTKDSALLDTEVLLSNAFMLYVTHINVGCIDQVRKIYRWKKEAVRYSLEEELDRVAQGASAVAVIEDHQPDFWEYRQLQKGLVHFLDQYPLGSNRFEIPPPHRDAKASQIAARRALVAHAFLDSTASEQDSAFATQLKKFQLMNGLKDDGVIGKWTRNALSKSHLDRFYSAALGLEKWRWKSPYPQKYIRVNIPECVLYFFADDTLKRKHRVVVGALDTPTPAFQATLKTIVTTPFWHVPYSIASTEILSAAQRDSNYILDKGFEVFKDGKQVDLLDIDWSTWDEKKFPFRIRQNGGGGNSLGKIKFLFPNKYAVFIHDTPSKRFFDRDVRAYSHGCVRLQHPVELANSILTEENNRIDAEKLRKLIQKGNQQSIRLKEEFEVYIEYITAVGDSSGTIHFYPDIYQRDAPWIRGGFEPFY